MKGALPILGAGGAFTGSAVAGLFLGILAAARTGSPGWVFGGLAAGLVLGAYSAFQLLRRSLG